VKAVLPQILSARECGEERVLSLYIDPELQFFMGHFPGYPLLPDVVQLDWAIRCAVDAFGPLGDFRGLEKLKFQALIRPGEHLNLRLSFDPKSGRLLFSYEGVNDRKSSGTITFSPKS